MVWNPWINRGWNPWQELSRVQAELDRLLRSGSPSWSSGSAEYPAINLWSGERGLRLCARLPGLEPGDVELSVVGDTLTLKGGVERETHEQSVEHRSERQVGRFARTFQLPFEIDGEAVEARFQNGLLEVELPRAKSQQPKRIAVKTA